MPEQEDDIKQLLEQNKKMNEETLELVRYIKRFVMFQQVFGVIKILLIMIPIILGIIYLPPILDEIMKQYQQVLNFGANTEVEMRQGSGEQSIYTRDWT